MKKYIIALFAAITLTLTLAGCQTEAQKVSQNLPSKQTTSTTFARSL